MSFSYNVNNFQAYNVLFNKCKRNAKKLNYLKQFEIRKENVKQTWTLIRDVIGSQTKKRKTCRHFLNKIKTS